MSADIPANKVTLVGLLVGISAAVLVASGHLAVGVLVFYLATILDYTDGSMARVREQSSFYGKYIDGMIDIVNMSAVRLALAYTASVRGDIALQWLGVVSAVLTPFHHFSFDRYSTFARWINKLYGNDDVKPYIRPELSLRRMNAVSDAQHLLLLFSLVRFEALWGYFLLIIYAALFYALSHVRRAYLHMNVRG